MVTLPVLKKHYCPFCQHWVKNLSIDPREEIYQHDHVPHPVDAMNYISQTEYNN